MTELKIDKEAKTIDAQLELTGETALMDIHIGSYTFDELPDGSGRLVIKGITISKPWMETIANNILTDKPLAIPKHLAQWIKMVL